MRREKLLPGGNGAIPQQPVDQFFSHNAVGVRPQPIAVVLELHSCAVVADFLPQVLQLGGVLHDEDDVDGSEDVCLSTAQLFKSFGIVTPSS